jgi:hypothetical protein
MPTSAVGCLPECLGFEASRSESDGDHAAEGFVVAFAGPVQMVAGSVPGRQQVAPGCLQAVVR